MPRNGSGSYGLPAGNPVSSGTLIEASWANTTLSDLASAMTDSLARSGEGGMTGPLRVTDGSVSTPSLSFGNETSTGFYRAGATDVRFAMAGVDVATMTTAGVTVGSTKVLALPDGTAAAPSMTNTGDTNTGLFFPADNAVAVSTDGTERLRVDASGNLGLGVTPSAWGSSFKAIQVGSGAAFVGSNLTSQSLVLANAYSDAVGLKYINTAQASYYQQYLGAHQWYTAPSGTAGDAITFTQAMTLDAFGNLGLGVTPSPWSASYKALQFPSGGIGAYSTSSVAYAQNAYDSGAGAWKYLTTGVAAGFYNQSLGTHVWGTAPTGTAGDAITFTQAMTLDASGNLGLGVTPSPWGSTSKALQFPSGAIEARSSALGIAANAFHNGTNWAYSTSSAAALYSQNAGQHFWYTAPSGTAGNAITFTQAMTLTANGGSLLVGTTNSSSLHNTQSTGFQYFPASWLSLNSSDESLLQTIQNVSAFTRFYYRDTGQVGSINYNGSGVTYNTSSDYRLKENVQPMTGALAKVAALKPCTYTWKASGTAGQGFIAHELAEVVPDAVVGEKDAVNEDGSIKAQGIDTSFLVATLTAAIKEQQAIITQLTARIEALESAS